ncbi:MAG: hypothetical protein Q8S23_08495 [Bacteroidales bacterium]|nr:hypothetical protein [Bacteroidales bacterium]
MPSTYFMIEMKNGKTKALFYIITAISLLLVIAFFVKLSRNEKIPVAEESSISEYSNQFSGKPAIIEGEIFNREVYPQTKSLKLTIPAFEVGNMEYITEIDSNNRFRFVIYPMADREINIYPISDIFLAGEGDSIFIRADFRQIQNPVYSGNKADLNNLITKFRRYYQGRYVHGGKMGKALIEEADIQKSGFISLLNNFRKDERAPSDFVMWAEQTIEADYLLFLIQSTILSEETDGIVMDRVKGYNQLTESADKIFNNRFILKSYFDLTTELVVYKKFHYSKITGKKSDADSMFLLIPDDYRNRYLSEFILAAIANGLLSTNRTDFVKKNEAWLDSYLSDPFLRKITGMSYNRVKNFNSNPKPLSDEMLGKTTDIKNISSADAHKNSVGLKVINKIIDANPGKVIYIDFWALWCYPCISNLNTSLKLINELTGKDVLFVNICIMTSRDLWEESYKSEHDQIISLHMNTQEANAVMRQFRFSGVPYGILINKEGYVVDFGNHVRAESDYLKADILKLLEN